MSAFFKKKTCWQSLQKWSEIELFTPYGFTKNLPQAHPRRNHVKSWEIIKSAIPHEKVTWLDWSKTAKQFSVSSHGKFLWQY